VAENPAASGGVVLCATRKEKAPEVVLAPGPVMPD